MAPAGGARSNLVAPDSAGPRRSRRARFLALTLALVLVLGVGVWATWAAVNRGSGDQIADGDAHPGASATEDSTPEAVDLQPDLEQLSAPGRVAAESDADATNQLTQALFTSAPVVIVVGTAPEDLTEILATANSLAAPILVASDDLDLPAALAEVSAQAVLAVGEEVAVPAGVTKIELSDTWHEDLREELGPIIEPQAVSGEERAAFFQGTESDFPLAASTAAAAGFPAEYLGESSLLAAAPDLTAVTEMLLVGTQPPAAETLNWQYAVLNQEKTLPGGGYELFAGKRYVALYGSPGVPALGVLGQKDLDGALELAQEYAGKYDKLTDDEVIPAFEIIATVASAGAGADGKFSNRLPVETLRPWVEAAGEAGYYVLLDLQPGRTHFLEQAQEYEELLQLPNVGLALDPEWRLKKDQRHLQQIGSVSAKEVNEVADWLAELVQEHELPPKMLVLHQFSLSMIKDRSDVRVDHPELSVVIHADGQGTQGAKNGTWKALHKDAPAVAGWGWKNFLKEDHPVLSPKETYNIEPPPELVTYQ